MISSKERRSFQEIRKLQATLAQLVERLIRNFRLDPYAIDSLVGVTPPRLAYSAYRALIEPDFEPIIAGLGTLKPFRLLTEGL